MSSRGLQRYERSVVGRPWPRTRGVADAVIVGNAVYHTVGDREDAVKQLALDWNATYSDLAHNVFPHSAEGGAPPSVAKRELGASDAQMRAGFVPALPIGTRAGELGVAGANPMWVLFWFDTFKPAVDQWVMFRAKMLGLDRTVAANYIAYADRWAADWGEFVAWRDRLIKLRTIAKTFGMKLTSPEPAPLGTTLVEDAEDRIEKIGGAAAAAGGAVATITKIALVGGIGLGAIFLGTQLATAIQSKPSRGSK